LRAGVRAAVSAMAVREAAEAAGDGLGSMMLATLTGKTKTRRVSDQSRPGDEVGQMMVGVQVVMCSLAAIWGRVEVPQVRALPPRCRASAVYAPTANVAEAMIRGRWGTLRSWRRSGISTPWSIGVRLSQIEERKAGSAY